MWFSRSNINPHVQNILFYVFLTPCHPQRIKLHARKEFSKREENVQKIRYTYLLVTLSVTFCDISVLSFISLHFFSRDWVTRKNSNTGTQIISSRHGLINYIDTKQNIVILKNGPVKGFCLSELIDCRYSQTWWYFRPRFVNCCPSTFSLVQLSLLPSFPVWISILYTRIKYARGRGYRVLGLRRINTFRKVPLQVNFVRWRTNLHCLLWV